MRAAIGVTDLKESKLRTLSSVHTMNIVALQSLFVFEGKTLVERNGLIKILRIDWHLSLVSYAVKKHLSDENL